MFKSTPIKSLPLDRIVIYAFIGICLSLIGITVTNHMERKAHEPVLTYSDAPSLEDANVLMNTAGIKKQDAQEVSRITTKIHTGNVKANAHGSFTSSRPRGEGIDPVQETKEHIKNKDPHLPPLALKDTDKTLIAPSTKENVDVDVYKINTYRNWELGAGIGTERGNVYVPISLQRNYTRNHSIVAELHFSPEKNMSISGGEVQWKIHFGK